MIRSNLHTPLRAAFRHSRRRLALVSYDNNSVSVSLGTENPKDITFSSVFLRDACNSTASVDPSTSQKNFGTAYVARGLEIVHPPEVISGDSEHLLQITWKHHDQSISVSQYPESFLVKSSTPETRFQGKFFHDKQKFWNRVDLLKDLKSIQVDYHAYLDGTSTFARSLKALNKYGICFVNNVDDPLQVPQTETLSQENSRLWPVYKMAQRYGYIKSTFYGDLFDVKNDKNAKNVANTNVYLPLHMDLCYYESPPGLQLLHYIQNSTQGGESVFADSFLAVEHVRDSDPAAYEALKKVPITFHYENNNEYYYYMRPMVVEEPYLQDTQGRPLIQAVNYSPPFQGPFEHHITASENPQLFEDFLRGMVLFEKAITDSANQYTVKMPENSCVIFDNRRVLHSRLAFSDQNGGDRWLMGCYVDGDSYRSKLRTQLASK